MFAFWLCIPLSSRVKPDQDISSIHQSSVLRRPIGCAIGFRCGLIHLRIILLDKPLQIGLCNKAYGKSNHMLLIITRSVYTVVPS